MARPWDKVMPAGIEKMLKAVFEDVPERLTPRVVGGGIQGIEVVEKVVLEARGSLCAVDEETRFLHDGYLVYLERGDYDRLKPIFSELKGDIFKRLNGLMEELGARTKSGLTLEFIRGGGDAGPGDILVDSYYKVDAAQTMLIPPGMIQSGGGLSFQAEGFEVADEDWRDLHDLFKLIDAKQYGEAVALIRRQDLNRSGNVLGQLLECLCLFLDGRFESGMRRLNGSVDLRENEHGLYLQALGYLNIGDPERADTFAAKAVARNLNPMGCLIQGISSLYKGEMALARGQLELASQEVVLQPACEWFQSYLGDDLPRAEESLLKLLVRGSRQAHVIAARLPLGLQAASRRNDGLLAVCDPLEAPLRLAFKGWRLQVMGSVTVSDQVVPANGHLLEPGDTIRLGKLAFVYSRRRFGGTWSKTCSRRFGNSCHVLEDQSGEETWYFPTDHAVTIGRGKECGNDLIFEDDPKMTTRGHAEITWANQGFHLSDLDSTNGTAKNGERLLKNTPVALARGDRLQLGNCLIEICQPPLAE